MQKEHNDGIPHPILFRKAMDVIPENSCNLYLKITVKFNLNRLCNAIEVCKGTRKGDLS